MLSDLKFGDQLVVYKLDRLARSLRDLLNIIERVDGLCCDFKSLTEPIDTGTPAGRLMLQILGAVAEFERSLIRERSMAGQAVAMSRGIHCGRPRVLSSLDESALLKLWSSGHYTLAALATVFEVHELVVKRAVYRRHKPGHSSLL